MIGSFYITRLENQFNSNKVFVDRSSQEYHGEEPPGTICAPDGKPLFCVGDQLELPENIVFASASKPGDKVPTVDSIVYYNLIVRSVNKRGDIEHPEVRTICSGQNPIQIGTRIKWCGKSDDAFKTVVMRNNKCTELYFKITDPSPANNWLARYTEPIIVPPVSAAVSASDAAAAAAVPLYDDDDVKVELMSDEEAAKYFGNSK